MGLRLTIALYAIGTAVCVISAAQEKSASVNSADSASPKVKVYAIGKDVTAPELIPRDYSSILVSTCERIKSVKADIKFIVDAVGVPHHGEPDDSTDTNVGALLLQWIATMKFKPALRNGSPVAAAISDKIQVEVCYSKETDATGNPVTRLHLHSVPTQEFVQWRDAPNEFVDYATKPDLVKMEKPEHIGGSVKPPIVVYTVDPPFSKEAREKHIQGECMVQVIIDANGMTTDPRIVRPIGYGLDELAIEAVKKYRFKPATKDGKPVPVYMTIAINFR